MAVAWAVVVLDTSNGNAEQNVRSYWDASTSKFHPISHYRPEQSDWRLRFDATISLNIREGQPYMAGYRDTVTRVWDSSRAVYCGQIGKQTGSGLGRSHIILDLLDDWAVAFSDAGIIHWPNNDFLSVYPAGYSVRDWMVGTRAEGKPFDGFMQPPSFDPGRCDLAGGVDPVFSTLIIDNTYIPSIGKSVVYGAGQFCPIKDALDTMVAVSRFILPGIDPVAFMEPVVSPSDPTQVIPRFRFIDRNDTGGAVDATYTVTNPPPAGQYSIEQPASHERDIRPAKQRVVVVGKGGDPTLPGHPLVFVDYYNPAHSDQYPAYLNAVPGRILFIDDNRIETLAAARAIATATEALVYGPTGRITFHTAHPTTPGKVVALNWPQEVPLGARFVVAGVRAVPNPGRPLYELTIGEPAPDLRILLDRAVNSALNDTTPITLGKTLAPGLGHGGTPGKGSRQPLDGAPHTSAQNTTTARTKDVVAHTIKGTAAVKPGAIPGAVVAANVTEYYDAQGNLTDYHTPNGVSPARVAMDFAAAGTATWLADEDGTMVRLLVSPGTLVVTMTLRGSAATLPAVYKPGASSGDPPILVSAGTPLPYKEGDPIAVTVNGAGQVVMSHRAPRVGL